MMLSIVVPVFNEEESLNAFYSELVKTMSKLKEAFEVLFVDDGSTDSSLQILKTFQVKNKNIRVFSFRRNLGKSEALSFGFQKSLGETIVTLDADLQDQPSEIPNLLKLNKQGIDLVCGWRKNRQDKKKMLIISRLFNKVMNLIFGLNVHDYNCGLKVYSRNLAKSLRLYGGLHRFVPLLAHQQGFTVDELVVHHEVRKFGKSKYGFSKIFKDLPDIFTMIFLVKFGKKPLHFFGFIGIIFGFLGFIMLSYLTYIHYAFGEKVGTRPLLFVGILFIISGFQAFFTGFLADLFINISHASKNADETNHFPLKYSTD